MKTLDIVKRLVCPWSITQMRLAPWIIPAIVSAGSAVLGSRSASRAADAQADASREAIAFQRESRDLVRSDTAHLRKADKIVTDALLSMVGLPGVGSYGYQAPNDIDADSYGPGPGINPAADNHLRARERRSGEGGFRRTSDTYGWQSGGAGSGGDQQLVRHWTGGRIGMRYGGYLPEGYEALVGEDGPELGVPQGGSYGGAMPPPPAVVGQNGPEVVQGGPGGTQIIPNPATTSGVAENPGGQPGRYNFMTDPGYGFRYDEGLRALNTTMAARGRSVGTAMDRSTLRYGQGLASSEYANVFNRLNAIRTGSQTGLTQSNNAVMQSGYGMGQAAQNAGDARASGYLGQYAAWANAGNELARMGGEYGWWS